MITIILILIIIIIPLNSYLYLISSFSIYFISFSPIRMRCLSYLNEQKMLRTKKTKLLCTEMFQSHQMKQAGTFKVTTKKLKENARAHDVGVRRETTLILTLSLSLYFYFYFYLLGFIDKGDYIGAGKAAVRLKYLTNVSTSITLSVHIDVRAHRRTQISVLEDQIRFISYASTHFYSLSVFTISRSPPPSLLFPSLLFHFFSLFISLNFPPFHFLTSYILPFNFPTSFFVSFNFLTSFFLLTFSHLFFFPLIFSHLFFFLLTFSHLFFFLLNFSHLFFFF